MEQRKVKRTRNGLKDSRSERWLRMRRAELMSHTSEAEKEAYRLLCGMGYKVIRQYPIDTGRKLYFADLYIPSLNAIIEIDGGYHYTKNQRRSDTNRSNGLWRKGFHVLRLPNRNARNIEKILSKLRTIDRR